ncbi:MAG: LuxR family transcriptional regulator [Gammaproteobacteria bacterium]|nr:MAG: LuxR family transcriptional regulator [Gammaproteobacteria bacterium]
MNHEQLKRHISFIYCAEIDEICKPLFNHTPIKVFEYSRVCQDGSRVELSNHAGHMENAFLSRAKMSRIYTPELIPENQRYLLINNWIASLNHPTQKLLLAQLHSQHELFGIGNELSVIRKHKQYYEYFHFYASSDAVGIENFYFNNLDMLERFIIYFINEAHDIIKNASKDPLVKPWRAQGFYQAIKLDDGISFPNFDKNAFIKATRLKRFFLTVNDKEIYLTKREIDCAILLAQGKSNRIISEELFISQRTVETHIESLRLKTNCDDRVELINFLLCNGIHAYLINTNKI